MEYYKELELELNQKHFKNKEWLSDFYRYPKLLAKII
jgi:SRSO17 transposase